MDKKEEEKMVRFFNRISRERGGFNWGRWASWIMRHNSVDYNCDRWKQW